MSSTTARDSRKIRSRPGILGPTRARAPTRKAVSVEITTPHACAYPEGRAIQTKSRAGTTSPAIAAVTGTSARDQLVRLADRELAPHLQPDGEEEDRHQRVVDQGVQREIELDVAEADREVHLPERFVGAMRDVGPDDRDSGGDEQQERRRPVLPDRPDLLRDGVPSARAGRARGGRVGGCRGSAHDESGHMLDHPWVRHITSRYPIPRSVANPAAPARSSLRSKDGPPEPPRRISVVIPVKDDADEPAARLDRAG